MKLSLLKNNCVGIIFSLKVQFQSIFPNKHMHNFISGKTVLSVASSLEGELLPHKCNVVVVPNWKEFMTSLAGKWTNCGVSIQWHITKQLNCYINTHNKINLKSMQSERTQTSNLSYCMMLFIWNPRKEKAIVFESTSVEARAQEREKRMNCKGHRKFEGWWKCPLHIMITVVVTQLTATVKIHRIVCLKFVTY